MRRWRMRCSQKCQLCVGERRERNWCRGVDEHDEDHLCHDHAGVSVLKQGRAAVSMGPTAYEQGWMAAWEEANRGTAALMAEVERLRTLESAVKDELTNLTDDHVYDRLAAVVGLSK